MAPKTVAVAVLATLLLSAAAVSVVRGALITATDDDMMSKFVSPNWPRDENGRLRRPGGGLKRDHRIRRNLVKTPRPHEYLAESDIPRDWDWRNVNNSNFLTPSRNQHIPNYCGSCWAMGSTSSMADRIRIIRRRKFPDFMIAVQTAVYCLSSGCGGGDDIGVYAFAAQNGIGPDTCQNYVAEGDGTECYSVNKCETCIGIPPLNCTPITEYPKFGVSEYGTVPIEQGNVMQMKAEIYARGPISCGVDSDPIYFWGLTPAGLNASAIFTGGMNLTAIDHIISVVGYGYDDNQNMPYWVIRNSWGEYWGNRGFFRLKMGENQLGLEGAGNCGWAVPTVPPHLMP